MQECTCLQRYNIFAFPQHNRQAIRVSPASHKGGGTHSCHRSRQRMPPQSPTHAAAIANACRRDRQRMPLQSPTHAAAVDIQTRQTGGQTPGAFIPIPHWGGGQAGLPRFRWKPAPPHSTRVPKANSHAATEHTPLPAGGRGGFHKPKTVRRPTWGNAPFLTQISRLRVRKEKRSDSHGQLLLTNNLY